MIDAEEHEPKTIRETLHEPDAEKQKTAMREELKSLEHNKIWSLEPLPKEKTALGCKWVYKINKDANGHVNRYKARLVAQGFSQK